MPSAFLTDLGALFADAHLDILEEHVISVNIYDKLVSFKIQTIFKNYVIKLLTNLLTLVHQIHVPMVDSVHQ